MGKLTPIEFEQFLKALPAELGDVVNNILPVVIGKKAVDVYTRNFQLQGFKSTAVEAWHDVKRRTEGKNKGAAATRKILTGQTGNLGRSIQYQGANGTIKIHSDLPYANAHNSGTRNAGKNRNVAIPQRKFIGDSNDVAGIVNNEIEKEFKDYLNFK